MNELRPQFTYHEGELKINSGAEDYAEMIDTAEDKDRIEKFRIDTATKLSEIGAKVTERDGNVDVSIDVNRLFEADFKSNTDEKINTTLGLVRDLLPFRPFDETDRVLALENMSDRGVNGVVNTSFQAWLNSGPVGEEVLRAALEAMSVPFSGSFSGFKADQYQYDGGDDWERGSDNLYEISIGSYDDFGKSYQETIKWRTPNLITIGSCACWGATFEDRRYMVDTGERGKWLYRMSPHNIDFGRQTLSLVLGGGVLARAASRYESTS